MLDDGNGGLYAPAAGAKDFKRAAETLKAFKKRVDAILENLENSEASRTRISRHEVARDSFGTGFGEAQDLHLQYAQVHSQLTRLSKTFGDQIEAMGIAVQGADIGFDNLEDDLRERFWSIQKQTKDGYEPRPAGDSDKERSGDATGADIRLE